MGALSGALKAGIKERVLGEELKHIGVRVPDVRKVVAAEWRELEDLDREQTLELAEALWSDSVYERRLAAVELLVLAAPMFTAADLPTIEPYLRRAKTWALVDNLAEGVVGQILLQDSAAEEVLDRWSTDDDFWLRRTALLEVSEGAVVSYVHNAVTPGMGKIGVLVALEGAAPAETLTALGKQIAMHIAAANPLALDAEGLDPAMLERERAIAIEKAKESGKPDNIVEKMVEGSMAKFRKENALLSQLFVIDNKTPVADVVAQAGKEAGSPITLKAFERFQLGEGIEKAESDFAAEVAAAAGVKKDEPVA